MMQLNSRELNSKRMERPYTRLRISNCLPVDMASQSPEGEITHSKDRADLYICLDFA